MFEVDVFIIATTLGIVASAGGALIKAFNLVRYLEGKIEALQANQKLQRSQIDAGLKLLDHRVRDLERYIEGESGFQPRYLRDDRTGAPFLEDL